jgi:hypothetical protein
MAAAAPEAFDDVSGAPVPSPSRQQIKRDVEKLWTPTVTYGTTTTGSSYNVAEILRNQ